MFLIKLALLPCLLAFAVRLGEEGDSTNGKQGHFAEEDTLAESSQEKVSAQKLHDVLTKHGVMDIFVRNAAKMDIDGIVMSVFTGRSNKLYKLQSNAKISAYQQGRFLDMGYFEEIGATQRKGWERRPKFVASSNLGVGADALSGIVGHGWMWGSTENWDYFQFSWQSQHMAYTTRQAALPGDAYKQAWAKVWKSVIGATGVDPVAKVAGMVVNAATGVLYELVNSLNGQTRDANWFNCNVGWDDIMTNDQAEMTKGKFDVLGGKHADRFAVRKAEDTPFALAEIACEDHDADQCWVHLHLGCRWSTNLVDLALHPEKPVSCRKEACVIKAYASQVQSIQDEYRMSSA